MRHRWCNLDHTFAKKLPKLAYTVHGSNATRYVVYSYLLWITLTMVCIVKKACITMSSLYYYLGRCNELWNNPNASRAWPNMFAIASPCSELSRVQWRRKVFLHSNPCFSFMKRDVGSITSGATQGYKNWMWYMCFLTFSIKLLDCCMVLKIFNDSSDSY